MEAQRGTTTPVGPAITLKYTHSLGETPLDE